MKYFYLSLLSVLFPLCAFGGEDAIGLCKVKEVYASSSGNYVNLENCEGNLGFKSRVLHLLFQNGKGIEIDEPEKTSVLRAETQSILAMKHAAELAYLFQETLRLQLDKRKGTPLFLSLVNPPKVRCATLPAPVPRQPEPTEGFKPVPPPPHVSLTPVIKDPKKTQEILPPEEISTQTSSRKKGTGLCRVAAVFSGPKSSFVDLFDCRGNLGFTNKLLELPLTKTFSVPTGDPIGSFTTVIEKQDILGLVQTAELAFLFQKRLALELDSPNGALAYFAVAETISPVCD